MGYVLAYPAYTQLTFPNPEFVLYVDDLQVVPGFENVLFRLLDLFTSDVQELDLEHLAIEGVCRRNSYKLFKNHDPLMNKLGWELEAEHSYWGAEIGETLTWLRWKPCDQEISLFDKVHDENIDSGALEPELEKQLAKLIEIMSFQVGQNVVKVQSQPPVKISRTRGHMPGFGEFRGN